MLTAERLRELMQYDPGTGEFRWRVSSNSCARRGDVAGCVSNDRWTIRIDRKLYYRYRLAWLWMTGTWPAAEIDHIDRDTLNDKFENLRLATHSQNSANTPARNKFGLKGVRRYRRGKKFQAQITKDGRNYFLGTYETAQEAHKAYCRAAKEIHGEFART